IRLDREMYRVTGVMPPAFRPLGVTADLWVAMAMDQSAMAWTGATTTAFGRLRTGVTPAMAAGELRTLAGELQKEFALAPNWSQGVVVVGLKESMVGAVR